MYLKIKCIYSLASSLGSVPSLYGAALLKDTAGGGRYLGGTSTEG